MDSALFCVTKGSALIIRKSAIAAGAIVVALGMSACSSDESSDAADTSSAASTSESANEHESEHGDLAAPSADELRATLDALADPQTPVDEKVTLVEKGDERRPNIETMTNAMEHYQVGFEVTNVRLDGTTATADVAVTSPHGAAGATPWTWEHVDGTWKVSDESTCGLLGMATAPC
ncbi:MAG: hypothetical protein GX610_24515 [Rhodococcus sp.]|nr:hypothetical protein [Rhodococcus sp. (in: high G+C Gram-positive bacteria)]